MSTDIAKFTAPAHPDLIFNQYLTTLALEKLFPQIDIIEAHLGIVEGVDEIALIRDIRI